MSSGPVATDHADRHEGPLPALGGDGTLRGTVPRAWSPLQVRALLFSALTLFFDGYDLLSISYAAPPIRADLQLDSGTMAQIFSMALLGMMAGGLLLGPMADRLGLREVTAASVLLAGVSTLLIAFADSAYQIMVLRFLVGVGLGGAMPGSLAIAGDYAAAARRRTILAMVGASYGLGGAAAGLFSSMLLSWASWHAVFLLGGMLSLVAGLLMILFMPQGLSFLVERRATGRLRALMARLPQSVEARPLRKSDGRGGGRFPVKILFKDGWWRLTIGLWGAAFLMLLTYYLLINWIPTMIAERHDAAEIGGRALTLLQFGIAGGGLAVGIAMDRFANRRLAFWAATLTAASAVAAAVFADTNAPLLLCCLLIGFFQSSTQGAINYTATLAYPPAARVTGIAWTLSIGRTGALLGPLVGGAILSMNAPLSFFFLVAGISAAASALVLFFAALEKHGDASPSS